MSDNFLKRRCAACFGCREARVRPTIFGPKIMRARMNLAVHLPGTDIRTIDQAKRDQAKKKDRLAATSPKFDQVFLIRPGQRWRRFSASCVTQADPMRRDLSSDWGSAGPRSDPRQHPWAAAAPWGSSAGLCPPSYRGCCRADAGSG
jgi:hypothetical protein